jgi:hypothetical protein
VNALAQAIEERDWDRAALLLLIGLGRAMENLRPETLSALVELLSAPEEPEAAGER